MLNCRYILFIIVEFDSVFLLKFVVNNFYGLLIGICLMEMY